MRLGILSRPANRRGNVRPSSIPGLVSWFDASQLTGLNDGDAVATLTDFSGNGNNATQATGSQQAIYKTAIQNGLPVVRYDGVDDYHVDSLALSGAVTILTVAKIRSTPAASSFFSMYTYKNAGSTRIAEKLYLNLAGYQPRSWFNDSNGTVTSVGIADALDTSAHALLITYNAGTSSAPASYTASLDGTTKTVVASGAANRTMTDLSAIGARVNSGGTPSAACPLDLCERCIYSRVLSAAEQTALIAYARTKWGV